LTLWRIYGWLGPPQAPRYISISYTKISLKPTLFISRHSRTL
jgi:hypothetical protein